MFQITHKASSNVQEFLSLFAEATNSETVTEGTTITRVNITDKIYLDASGSGVVVMNNGISTGSGFTFASTVFSKYDLIKTDKGVLFSSNASNMTNRFISVSNTASGSKGVVGYTSGLFTLTDNSEEYLSRTIGTYSTSYYTTQLIPIWDMSSTDNFDDGLYWVFIAKSIDAGQMVLNGKYYYIKNECALEYTP